MALAVICLSAAGNVLPSRRRAESSIPEPIARGLGSAAYRSWWARDPPAAVHAYHRVRCSLKQPAKRVIGDLHA